MSQKLTRSSTNRILGGVCAGIAEHFDWDPTVVRIAFLVAVVLGSAGLWLYLIAWAIIPAADGSSGVRQARTMWEDSKARRDQRETFDPYKD